VRFIVTIVLSKVDIKSWEELKNKYLFNNSHDLFKSEKINQIENFKFDDSNYIISTKFIEKLTLSFTDLIKEVEVTIVTNIILKMFENYYLMISYSNGLGMMVRGNMRNYIDTIIGPFLMKSLNLEMPRFQSIILPQNLMNWYFWGNELRSITVDIPEFGIILLKGKDLNNKINSEPSINNFLSCGSINEIKVYSNILKRIITVSRRGIIKAQTNSFEDLAEFTIAKIKKITL